jgi:NitT/TauT family transport system substrate-binding protein
MIRRLPFIALGLLFGLGLSPGARAADDVSLLLNWYLGGLHTPFYLGKQRGYYEEEGST